MQDSIGGNAKTLMFCNFSPSEYNVDETYSSLNYATRVKKIVNNATKQAESEEISRLKQIIKRLQSGQVVSNDDIAGLNLNEKESSNDIDEGKEVEEVTDADLDTSAV